MMCGKSVSCVLPLRLLRVSNPNRRPCPFRSLIFKFPSKIGLVVCGCRVAEEKDDDDDEFKEEIRTKR